MPSEIATALFATGILGLFCLDRKPAVVSTALWLPALWLLIAGSRSVSQWLNMAPLHLADTSLDGSPLDRAVFATLLIGGLGVLAGRGRQIWAVVRRNGPIILFVAYCAVSILWSDYPFVSLKRWFKLLGDVVMILVVLTERDPAAATKWLLSRLSFLLLPVSILLIKYYPEIGRGYSSWTYAPVVAGVTLNKNTLGAISTLLGLSSVWRLTAAWSAIEGRSWRITVAHGAILGMAIWLLLMADSATSLVCLIVGSFVIVLMTQRSFATPERARSLVKISLVLAVVGYATGAHSLVTDALERDPTLTGRTVIWELLIESAASPVVGAGFESFWLGARLDEVRKSYTWLNSAHNGFLEVFLNLGWLGLGLVGILMVTGYRNATASFETTPEVASLKLAYLMIVPIYAVSEAAFRMLNPIWLVFLLAIAALPKEVCKTTTMSVSARTREKFPWLYSRGARG